LQRHKYAADNSVSAPQVPKNPPPTCFFFFLYLCIVMLYLLYNVVITCAYVKYMRGGAKVRAREVACVRGSVHEMGYKDKMVPMQDSMRR